MTDTAAKPAPTETLTKYVILGSPDGTTFTKVATIAATTSEKALRKHLETGADVAPPSGTFVAIPARSWRPVTVTVETKTTIRLD